jgi:hypothetical protein
MVDVKAQVPDGDDLFAGDPVELPAGSAEGRQPKLKRIGDLGGRWDAEGFRAS